MSLSEANQDWRLWITMGKKAFERKSAGLFNPAEATILGLWGMGSLR
jgi:hypothetical protein